MSSVNSSADAARSFVSHPFQGQCLKDVQELYVFLTWSLCLGPLKDHYIDTRPSEDGLATQGHSEQKRRIKLRTISKARTQDRRVIGDSIKEVVSTQ